ncbi:T9SS type A sorting domain-containing protein [Chitinophagaceae bacterium MMS25-I14]
MKKVLFGIAFLFAQVAATKAQMNIGGLPQTMLGGRAADYVPVTTSVLPDWNSGLKNWDAIGGPKPYLVALMTPADLSFPNSGILYTAENGTRIWQAQFKVAGAKALGFYYDNFHLPEGVKFFLSNAGGKQVLGAYTSANNDASNKFASEAVEGSVVNIELNIEPGVDIADIKLHVDRAAAYFRSIDYLAGFQNLQTINAIDSALTGGSSVCMINAMCPLGNGYETQRNATFQTLIPVSGGVGACSSTMINTAANTPGNCKQYFLLATHCEFANDTTNAGFSQVLLRFNYQQSTCNPPAHTVPNTLQTMTGANFVARSVLPVDSQGNPLATQINGDFLLLELKSALPSSWGVTLAGWNNDANIPQTNTAPKKFIGFHHPGGDVKKVSSSHAIQSYSLGATDSHWVTQLDSGLVAEGSSGSALFDGDGHIIGVASVAASGQGVPSGCTLNDKGQNVGSQTSNIILYSKLSNDWNYSADGNAAIRKLKPWLNPNNNTVTTVNAVTSTCAALNSGTAVSNIVSLENGVAVFPNPSTTGKTTLKINLNEATDLTLNLFDINGKMVYSNQLPHVSSGNFGLDLSNYSDGVYLLKVSDGHSVISRKIALTR